MSEAGSGHGLGPTRAKVLEVLLEQAHPLDCSTVATRLGLHTNGARFHLDALVAAGYAAKSLEHRAAKGRPRVLYVATHEAPQVSQQHWASLTRAIVTHIVNAQPDPDESARAAGRAWGRSVAAPAAVEAGPEAPAEGETADADAAALSQHLRGAGFAVAVAAQDDVVEFTRCAFIDWDETDRRPICHLHLGLMEGYLEARGSSVSVERLTRGHRTCTAMLAPRREGVPPEVV